MSDDEFLHQLEIVVGQLQRKVNSNYPLPFPSHLQSREAEYHLEEQQDRARRTGGSGGQSVSLNNYLPTVVSATTNFHPSVAASNDFMASGSLNGTQTSLMLGPQQGLATGKAPQPTSWEDPTVAWLLGTITGTPTTKNNEKKTPTSPSAAAAAVDEKSVLSSLSASVPAHVFQQFNATLLRADTKLRALGPSLSAVSTGGNIATIGGGDPKYGGNISTNPEDNKAVGSPINAQQQYLSPQTPQQQKRETSVVVAQPLDIAEWWTHFNVLISEGSTMLEQHDSLLQDLTTMSEATRAVTEQSSHLSENASALLLRKAQLESTSQAMTTVLKRFNAMDENYRAAHHPGLTALSPQFPKLLDAIEEGMSFLTSVSTSAVTTKPQSANQTHGDGSLSPRNVEQPTKDGATAPPSSEADSFLYSPIDFKSTKAYTAKMASAHHLLITLLKDALADSFNDASGVVMGGGGGAKGGTSTSIPSSLGANALPGGAGSTSFLNASNYAKCFLNPKKAFAALGRHHGSAIGGATGGVGLGAAGPLGSANLMNAVLGRNFDAVPTSPSVPPPSNQPVGAQQPSQQQNAYARALEAAAQSAAADLDAEVRALIAGAATANGSSVGTNASATLSSNTFRLALANINDAFYRRVTEAGAVNMGLNLPHQHHAGGGVAASGTAAAALRRLFESRCAAVFQQQAANHQSPDNHPQTGGYPSNIFSTATSSPQAPNFLSANPFSSALSGATASQETNWETQLFNDVMAQYANARMSIIGPIVRDQLESFTEACERVLNNTPHANLIGLFAAGAGSGGTPPISPSHLILPLITERAVLVLRDVLMEEKSLYESLWLPAAPTETVAKEGPALSSVPGLVDDTPAPMSSPSSSLFAAQPVCAALLNDLSNHVYHFCRSQLILTDGFPSLAITCQYLLTLLVAGNNLANSESTPQQKQASGGVAPLWTCLLVTEDGITFNSTSTFIDSIPSAVSIALSAAQGSSHTPRSSDGHALQVAQQRVASALQHNRGQHSQPPTSQLFTNVSASANNDHALVRMLRDTQERLIFRCSIHLRQDIAHHKNDPREAVLLLRLLLSPQPASAFVLSETGNNSSVMVDPNSSDKNGEPDLQAAIFQEQPTVLSKGTTFLNLLYPVVDSTIFNTFAEECLRLLRTAVGGLSSEMQRLSTERVKTVLIEPIKKDLLAAATAKDEVISNSMEPTKEEAKSSDPKVQLRLIDEGLSLDLRRCPIALHALFHRLRCLLILRELIGRYPGAFAAPVTENRLDISAMVLHRRFELVAKTIDVRRDVEEDLRAVCEELIEVCAKLCVDAFRSKKSAPQLVLPPAPQMVATPIRPATTAQNSEIASPPTTPAQPSETNEVAVTNSTSSVALQTPVRPSQSPSTLQSPAEFPTTPLQACRSQLAFILHTMARYIDSGATRAVLARPIKTRIIAGCDGLISEESLSVNL